MAFLTVNNFFKCVFKYTDQKNTCASIVFKAESKRGGVFLKNQKDTFLEVQNGSF